MSDTFADIRREMLDAKASTGVSYTAICDDIVRAGGPVLDASRICVMMTRQRSAPEPSVLRAVVSTLGLDWPAVRNRLYGRPG